MAIYLSGGFTPPPSGPLTATPFPDATPPYVELEIVFPTAQTPVVVERLDPDGRWRPVRGAEPATFSAGGTWAGQDFEAPYGVLIHYRVLSLGIESVTAVDVGNGVLQLATELMLNVKRPWLVHPGIPILSQPFLPQSFDAVDRPARRGVFEVIGRDTPIVVSQRRKAASSSMTLLTRTPLERRSLQDLMADGQVLLLNVPPSLGFDLDTCYVSIGDVSEVRVVRIAQDPFRALTLPYNVVDRPVGGLQSLWSWSALMAENATWADVQANYANWQDLEAHRQS